MCTNNKKCKACALKEEKSRSISLANKILKESESDIQHFLPLWKDLKNASGAFFEFDTRDYSAEAMDIINQISGLIDKLKTELMVNSEKLYN